MNFVQFILENKEWLFSGIGIAVIDSILLQKLNYIPNVSCKDRETRRN